MRSGIWETISNEIARATFQGLQACGHQDATPASSGGGITVEHGGDHEATQHRAVFSEQLTPTGGRRPDSARLYARSWLGAFADGAVGTVELRSEA